MNFGIIGLGVMGKNHYRVLKRIDGVNIIALCDPFCDSSFSEPLYRDVDEFLDKHTFDALIIAVPTPLHKDVVLKCTTKTKAMLIEKPVAGTLKCANEILNATKGLITSIGHIERFNPVIETLKKELANKEVYSISITRVGPFPPRIGDVGVLTDLSVHDIDLVRFITGREFKDMKIFKSKKIINHSEDNAEISFKLDDEIVGNITTNWLSPFKRRKIEVACSEAYYEADLISQELMEYSNYQLNNSYISRWCFVQKGEPLQRELSAFTNYVKTGERGDLATIEDSIKTLQILEEYK